MAAIGHATGQHGNHRVWPLELPDRCGRDEGNEGDGYPKVDEAAQKIVAGLVDAGFGG